MKQFSIFAFLLFLFATSSSVMAQSTTATFKVWGNCGMCKTTIEGTSKTNGATFASWDSKSKILTVKYDASTTSEDKIQKGIAEAGYDNEKYTAPDNVYNNLHECCKYERKATTAPATEKKACCVKDGKCEGGKECCKNAKGTSDCCSKGTCAKEGGCCSTCEMKEGGACKHEGKEGACTHEGKEGTCKHEGKEGTCKHDGKHESCSKGTCKDHEACKKGNHAACKEKGCCKK